MSGDYVHKKLIGIKLLHTIIWAILAGMICYIVYAGISDKITPFVYFSIGAIILECLVLVYFQWKCPLTLLARKYSNSDTPNFDIYLPVWLAKHNKTIFSTLYVVGVALVIWRLTIN